MTPTESPALSRRDRLRARTRDEIQQTALAIVDSDGVDAVSLTAIAKDMGMSAPALYRYFGSREDLLDSLVTTAYAGLTQTMEQADAGATDHTPASRLRNVADAYRQWALAHPKRYTMIFGQRPDNHRDTAEAIATINRGMQVLLGPVHSLVSHAEAGPSSTRDEQLDRQLSQWASRREHLDAPLATLRLALLTWTRMHGIVGLEIIGAFDDMHLDAGVLLDAELDTLVDPTRPVPTTVQDPVGSG